MVSQGGEPGLEGALRRTLHARRARRSPLPAKHLQAGRNRAQRFIALDKKTGAIDWISTPGGRPYDTSYAPMNIVNVNGTRLLVTGGADGAALAIKPQTGEPVWNLVVAKRGLNTGIVVSGKYAILSHSEENLDTNEMGMIAAVDATGKGKLGRGSI